MLFDKLNVSTDAKISIDNLVIKDFTAIKDLTLVFPPTSVASLVIQGAGILLAELNKAQMETRLSRMEEQLSQILMDLEWIRGALGEISYTLEVINQKLDDIRDRVDYNALIAPARGAELAVRGNLGVIEDHWDDWIANPRERRDYMTSRYSDLEHSVTSLLGERCPEYFMTLSAALVIQNDLSKLLNQPIEVRKRQLQRYAKYFESAIALPSELPVDTQIWPKDSYPVRELKYKKAIANGLQLRDPSQLGSVIKTKWSYRHGYYGKTKGLPQKVLDLQILPQPPNELITIVDSEPNVSLGLKPHSRFKETLPALGQAAVSWSIYGEMHVLAHITLGSKFTIGPLFYYPKKITEAKGGRVSSIDVPCTYGLYEPAKSVPQFARAMKLHTYARKKHRDKIVRRVDKANHLMQLSVEAIVARVKIGEIKTVVTKMIADLGE